MHVGFVVFDDVTALDLVGVFDPVTRIRTMGYDPDFTWDLCARTDVVTAASGLTIEATAVEPSLDEYDAVVVPGGVGARRKREDAAFVDWIRPARESALVASVCTGSLLLGEAGLLDGRRATTHPSAFDLLEPYCTVVDDRIVDEGTVITARGVTAGIDLGLVLVGRLESDRVRREIKAQMDYPYGDSLQASLSVDEPAISERRDSEE